MEKLLNNCEPFKDLEQFETKYNNEMKLTGSATIETQFEYAFCLVHSRFNNDVRKGIGILENLASIHGEGKRDYIYYLAFGNARIKNYNEALKYCRAFLDIESNDQVRLLEDYIKQQSNKDLAKGVVVASGTALLIGGILGIAFGLLRR